MSQNLPKICQILIVHSKIQSSSPSSPSDQQFIPKQQSQSKQFYHWSKEENLRYISFLKQFKQIFKKERTRRARKVFLRMSEFVGTRNKYQCKSHHQKMLKAYRYINNIISALEKKLEVIKQNTNNANINSNFDKTTLKRVQKQCFNSELSQKFEKEQVVKIEQQEYVIYKNNDHI